MFFNSNGSSYNESFKFDILPTKFKNMKTLKLFNAVVKKESDKDPFISELGFIIEPGALWAKDRIIDYYTREYLNGNDLNKTFHKSWAKIKNSPRIELYLHQILHYLSTYGTDFNGEIYIPYEVLKVPDLKLKYKVIKAYTKEELIDKCLSLLKSGVALKEETVDDLISVLVDEFGYKFTGKEGIKNKEAIVKIVENYNVYPEDPVEFLRYVIYRTTDQTLLIKNDELINKIKEARYNPTQAFNNFGLEKLSEIFNRFKPLFLAYKTKCPKTINKISRLSKRHHKPMVENPLNHVTHIPLEELHRLDNATPFALFRALAACYTRKNEQDTFVYRIRNGKSWVEESKTHKKIAKENYKILKEYIKSRFKFNKSFFIPKDIEYALPVSEKMFVGNIPTGTRFYGKKLAVGVYWKNSWGAKDLDLSGLNIGGKVGWNSEYSQGGI